MHIHTHAHTYTCTHIHMYTHTHVHTYTCTHTHMHTHRLRKAVTELEKVVRSKDEAMKLMSTELKSKQREVQHQSQHITELKDLLQTSVHDKPIKWKAEHRMGRFCVCVCVLLSFCFILHLSDVQS